jgi:hypothetical protein
MTRSRSRAPRRLLAVVLVVVAVVVVAVWVRRDDGPSPGAWIGTIATRLERTEPVTRDLTAYAGLGAWVDGFDFGPAYTKTGAPPVAPRAVEDMAGAGVRTLFLQAARDDSRSPDGIVDRALVAEFLIRAHRAGVRVVGWFLPTFVDVEHDLADLRQIADFDAGGHRFDGVAVDIEAVEAVTDVDERNQRLVELSTRLRAEAGRDALGAIVLPPVLTEVVNQRYWPDFPYSALSSIYDVWLPMSYWTFRSAASGYHDGYTYNDESTRRLRNNLANDGAPVHAIGGIGDEVTPEELDRFAQSLVDDRAIGGSIYDWNTLTAAARAHLAALFATGPASTLPAPP